MIFIAIPIIVLLFVLIKLFLNNKKLVRYFQDKNMHVYGFKGKGKDTTFSNVIHRRKEPYLSNMDYGGKFTHINLKDLQLGPNTHENFIDGKIIQIQKHEEWEGQDIYITDAGIFLPSYFDYLLAKNYPSMPIFFALSRQLYNIRIHFNTQAFNRVWLKLREQQDGYLKCLQTFKFAGYLFTEVRFYDNPASAEQSLLPMKRKLFNKENNALQAQFYATHGIVEQFWTCQKIKNIHFDTRAFHQKLFGKKFENSKKTRPPRSFKTLFHWKLKVKHKPPQDSANL